MLTEILSYQKSNAEILKTLNQNSQIIVCNHPSLIDIVFFLAYIENANCIVKAELLKNIFLSPAIKACGYIPNTENEEFLSKGVDALKSGQSVVIFPEGGRTKDDIVFHKAAAYMAIKGAKTLAPIFLRMNPRSLKKGQKWYKTPKITIKYDFKRAPVINLNEFYPQKSDPARSRLLHKKLSEIYKKEFENG